MSNSVYLPRLSFLYFVDLSASSQAHSFFHGMVTRRLVTRRLGMIDRRRQHEVGVSEQLPAAAGLTALGVHVRLVDALQRVVHVQACSCPRNPGGGRAWGRRNGGDGPRDELEPLASWGRAKLAA